MPSTQDQSPRPQLVDRARQSWLARLIDTSRRNNLLFFRDLKTGTIDLSNCDDAALSQIIAGDEVSFRALWPDADLVGVSAKAREIARRALANEEERGLQTLFIAFGMATWPPDDDGRPAESAVLLIPIEITGRLTEGRNLAVRRKGEAQANLALLHVLDSAHRCAITADEVLAELDTTDVTQLREAFDRIRDVAKDIEGFAIADRIVIGNFSFQKLAMVRDLREGLTGLIAHDVIASLAGDDGAKSNLVAERAKADVSAAEIDQIRADREFLVIDADSSQQRVIASVLRGQSGVIQGPPGTGKSQTIVNLIAALAAEGKRVLFVAEKRAALQVVMERLDREGLDHLYLDLHGADISQRAVMQKIRTTLEVMGSVRPVVSDGLHEQFEKRRRLLNAHVARLHTAQPPSGLSVHQMQGRLLRSPHRPLTRWRGPELVQLTEAARDRVEDLLREAASFADLFFARSPSPWIRSRIRDGATAHDAVSLVNEILGDRLPRYERELAELRPVLAAYTLSVARTFDAIKLASVAAKLLKVYRSGIFALDLPTLRVVLQRARSGVFARLICWLKPSFRRARKQLLSTRVEAMALNDLLMELDDAVEVQQKWTEIFTSEIQALDVRRLERSILELRADLDRLAMLVDLPSLDTASLDDVRAALRLLANDNITPFRIPRFREVETELRSVGVDKLLGEISSSDVAPESWPDFFESAWIASSLDAARAADPMIGSFSGTTHSALVDEFKRLDKERIRVAVDRVRRTHAERALQAINAFPAQAGIVRREAEKKSRHLPLRKLVGVAPDVMTALCPCWMASPLSVSQLLPAERQLFDFVLFDEGSQVLPEDAVPAILRGRRVVIAGDRHQLPPTTFFADGGVEFGDEEVDVGNVEGFESVLNIASTFMEPWSLDWHYRSRDERLIAFSNHHVYRDRLVTFPGAGTSAPAITHCFVDECRAVDGDEESASPEVRRVVELVLSHAAERPHESLGVITMGIKHAQRIQAVLDTALRERDDLEEFFATDRRERFFVKNLERVQGDERDAIILSIGYGKDRGGNLRHHFGPLLYEGGERRLNVAVTRARSKMTVVSSFLPSDIDPARVKGNGVRLLRAYLEYAASSGAVFGTDRGVSVPLNDFEADIFDMLSSRGIPLEPQWGVSGYRIDLAAKHPLRPGRFVLAIECDGASYHSAPTARDRDRLRQQQLEALGWRFHRIWSTDWFHRREDEIARALTAYEKAIAHADEIEAQQHEVEHTVSSAAGAVNRQERPRRKLPRPLVPVARDISGYRDEHIDSMMLHIKSDGLLRSDDELVALTARELGFERVGSRIRSRLLEAAARVRARA
jgi:very-short-patch-repair endonuclease